MVTGGHSNKLRTDLQVDLKGFAYVYVTDEAGNGAQCKIQVIENNVNCVDEKTGKSTLRELHKTDEPLVDIMIASLPNNSTLGQAAIKDGRAISLDGMRQVYDGKYGNAETEGEIVFVGYSGEHEGRVAHREGGFQANENFVEGEIDVSTNSKADIIAPGDSGLFAVCARRAIFRGIVSYVESIPKILEKMRNGDDTQKVWMTPAPIVLFILDKLKTAENSRYAAQIGIKQGDMHICNIHGVTKGLPNMKYEEIRRYGFLIPERDRIKPPKPTLVRG